MDDQVGVKWAVLLLSFGFRCITNTGQSTIRATGEATQTSLRVYDFRGSARATLKVKFCCSRGEDRCRNDDSWHPHKFVHGIRSKFTDLKEVETRFDRDLNFGDCLGGCFCSIRRVSRQRVEDVSRDFSRRIFKLEKKSIIGKTFRFT